MSRVCYRFGAFHLDPHARELRKAGERVTLPTSHIDCLSYLIQHRDRPVGRDELTAAVWDRVDVSDVSLNHAIMRLRRQLGLSGGEQEGIRTVWGVGYRWVMETVVEAEVAPEASNAVASVEVSTLSAAVPVRDVEPVGLVDASTSAPVPVPVVEPESPQPTAEAPRAVGRRVWGWGLAALAGLVLVGWALSLHRETLPAAPGVAVAPAPAGGTIGIPSALVLPAETDTPEGWAWLRLGVMDLVANQLRRGGLAVTPSETVVGLLNAQPGLAVTDAAMRIRVEAPGAWVVRPRLRLVGANWHMNLDATDGRRTIYVDALDKDVLGAARAAADRLLVKLGRVPPATTETTTSGVAEEVAQRVSAAVLAGQIDVARTLIAEAPQSVRAAPEIALSQAGIDFFSGDYHASARGTEALLASLDPKVAPRLRARALNRLGATYYRQGKVDEADAAFAEAIALAGPLEDFGTLATAYTGRGAVAGRKKHLEDAARLFGQARTLHERGNDAFGMARVDLNLGALAMDRAQPAVAVPILEGAAARLEALAVPEARTSALRSLMDAQLMLLRYADALATSERFWPPEAYSRNAREQWWLMLSRAVALAANGRLGEAEQLASRIKDSASPTEDAAVRAEADALVAGLAYLRGNDEAAVRLAEEAMSAVGTQAGLLSRVTVTLTELRALHRLGRVEAAGRALQRLHALVDPPPADWTGLFVRLADAEQAGAQGRQAEALAEYAAVLSEAEATGVPEHLLVVAETYVPALIAAGQVDAAGALAGRVAPWADQDPRAALIQARFRQALGDRTGAERAYRQARQLAGERELPPFPFDGIP